RDSFRGENGVFAPSVMTGNKRLRVCLAVSRMWKYRSVLIPVRIREHVITNYRWQIVASGNKLTESSLGRAEGVEFLYGKATFGVSALEVGEFRKEIVNDPGRDGVVDPGHDFDVARVESDLPLVGRRDNNLPTDEFTPVHVIAEGS